MGGSASLVYLSCFEASSWEKKGSGSEQESFSSKSVIHLFSLKHLLGAKYVKGGEGERETKIQCFKFFSETFVLP